MARTKNRDGVKVPYTDEEEAARDKVEAQEAIKRAARDADHTWKRRAEYPSIEECVHAILDDDLVALQEKRAAVKAKYPKGG